MSDEWPPQEWLDALVAAGADDSVAEGLNATVNFVVTGAPGGEARYFLGFDGGRITRAERGSLPEADVTFTQTFEDADAMMRGEFDASAAFMQGRMKFSGDMAKLMSPNSPLLPAITTLTRHAA